MGEWIELALAFVLVGAYSVAVAWLAFRQGQQSYKQPVWAGTRVPRPSLPKPTDNAPGVMTAVVQCPECRVHGGSHHPQCPNAQPKEKRVGKPWVGFSRAKRELESKETETA